jgi:HlyD family secretion protein
VLVDEGDKVTKANCWRAWTPAPWKPSATRPKPKCCAPGKTSAAQANVQLRQSEQLLAQQELKRSQELFKHGFASAQIIDQQQARWTPATLR